MATQQQSFLPRSKGTDQSLLCRRPHPHWRAEVERGGFHCPAFDRESEDSFVSDIHCRHSEFVPGQWSPRWACSIFCHGLGDIHSSLFARSEENIQSKESERIPLLWMRTVSSRFLSPVRNGPVLVGSGLSQSQSRAEQVTSRMGNAIEKQKPLKRSHLCPWKQDSQRSHLSSFTMKLMDKFHSPKIKRTPSKKGKPAEVSVKIPEKPVNKNLSWLEEKEKEVVSALRYFKTIVDKMAIDKKVLEMLPGSASKVLEAILPLVQSDPRIQHSSALSSCYSRVYQSLANLIRWSDQVMLEGVNSEDKEMVTTVKGVIKAVLDGVKELVRLTIEKQGHPSPTSPVKPSSPACKPDGQSELPLTDREVEILNKTTGLSQSAEGLPDSTDEEVAPPKPPLPGIRVVDNSPPPALPPKKRQSAPSPTRVAVVAPMSRATSGSSLPVGINRQRPSFSEGTEVVFTAYSKDGPFQRVAELARVTWFVFVFAREDFDVDCYAQRRLSGGSHSYGGESPRLSPCSSIGKLSKSDEQLSSLDRDSGQCSRNTSCETLDHYDPDYEFLQQDLSNADQIPQQVACNLSPLPESLGESGSPFLGHPFQLPLGSCPQPEGPSAPGQQMDVPPALPEKKRRSAASQTADSSGCRVSYERHPSQYDNISEEDLQNPASVQSVPFTPFAAILPFQQGGSSASVEFVGDFTVPESTGDPEKPPPLPEKKNKHNSQQASYAASSFSSVSYCVQQTKVAFTPEDGSATQGISVSVSNSFLSRHGNLPVPSVSRSLLLATGKLSERASEGESVSLYASGQSSEEALKSPEAPEARSEEEVDELSLIDHSEIMARLTLKQEGDDGPDVRGGSGDILLVHATETDRKALSGSEQQSWCCWVTVGSAHMRDRPGTLHDFHSHEIAEQLTLLDAELFYKIEIPEVLLWAKEQNEEKSPNLTQFTEHFNNMSYWHYDIRRNDDIINFFNDFSDHLAEEALWELSLKIKPRNITRRKTDREEKT
ncbi:hypothetical protein E2I00_004288 [Balaenoptera physalus]|uniref:Ras-GEF domain-containing protein n=1 Tax=Balaenoptera physalus TaxID=9770 RepID=A0A6A1QEK4_BALPH|nr:hypothetical protein E2I00_004288 [Balaenoptera physalus]